MPPSTEDGPQDDVATIAAQADTAASPAGTEGSGSSPDAVEERSHADVVAEAFLKEYGEEKVEAPAPAAEPQPEEDAPPPARQEGAEEPKGKARLSDEQWNALPPEARQRIGYLSEQLRTAKAASQEIETYRTDAEALGKLRGFTEQNGMSGQDVTNALHLGALLSQGKYEDFLTAIEPIYRRAAQAAGREAAPDLQSLVDAGEVTPEIAKRMTQAEVARQQAEAVAQREREQRTAQDQQAQAQAAAQQVITAVRAEETTLRASDPDYAQKEPAIRGIIGSLVKNGWRPANAEAAVAMLRDVHKQVAVPKPALRPTAPTPGASDTPRRSAAARTTLEAVQNALIR